MKFNWLKRVVSGPEASGVIALAHAIPLLTSRSGKSPFGGAIEKALAAFAALPGDIVEADEHGAARVVSRRLRIAGEVSDVSEQAIRARLGAIYGDDVSNLVDVTARANVVVFRRPNHA